MEIETGRHTDSHACRWSETETEVEAKRDETETQKQTKGIRINGFKNKGGGTWHGQDPGSHV